MPTGILVTTLQAAGLSAISNTLAQFIKANREQRPLGVNLRPFLQFVLFTVISCPPNILWQDFLEDKFPGYSYDISTGAKFLDKGNTARKFLFDQTLGAFINTLAFVGAMAAFKGKSLQGIQRELERDVVPLMISGWKLWPLVSIINFTLVPLDRRIILGSVVGLFWGIYLSLYAAID